MNSRPENTVAPSHTSGFISILGRPNAGKSTLLNALVGSKVAIVADKPQTTRSTVQGVWTGENAQVVFLDTPGIHKAESAIQKRMMDSVRAALDELDLLLFLADVSEPYSRADDHALDLLRRAETPAILVINKIDLLENREQALPLMDEYRKRFEFRDTVPVSAAKGTGVEQLRSLILTLMPEGPAYFPPDHITDQPSRFLASELIREQVLHVTRQEVPHAVLVVIERWEETPALIRIHATIYVERDGQKKIIIGSHGSMIKHIGMHAREEMEKLFDTRVHLELFVKVTPGWREKGIFLNAIDWRTMTGNDNA